MSRTFLFYSLSSISPTCSWAFTIFFFYDDLEPHWFLFSDSPEVAYLVVWDLSSLSSQPHLALNFPLLACLWYKINLDKSYFQTSPDFHFGPKSHLTVCCLFSASLWIFHFDCSHRIMVPVDYGWKRCWAQLQRVLESHLWSSMGPTLRSLCPPGEGSAEGWALLPCLRSQGSLTLCLNIASISKKWNGWHTPIHYFIGRFAFWAWDISHCIYVVWCCMHTWMFPMVTSSWTDPLVTCNDCISL